MINDCAQADQGPGDQGADRGREPVEEFVQVRGEISLDVEDREAKHQDEAGQHEPQSGEEAAELATAQPTEVDAELVRLGTGQHLVDGECLLEGLLGDPSLLVHTLVLDHRDLGCGASPGEGTELQETGEDRAVRVGSIRPPRGICAWFARLHRKATLAAVSAPYRGAPSLTPRSAGPIPLGGTI